MCLGVPMKVVSRNGEKGVAELDGVKRQIGLHLLADVEEGDYVVVHAGFAIQRLDRETAKEILDALKEF